MHTKRKKVKYPENKYLKKLVTGSGRSVKFYAEQLKVSRLVVSSTINGHYKGENIVPKLLELLEKGKI